MKQKNNSLKSRTSIIMFVIICIVLIGVIISIYVTQNNTSEDISLQSQTPVAPTENNNGKEKTDLLDNTISPNNKKSQIFNEEEFKNDIYKELQDYLIFNDYNEKVNPSENYVVLTSILSNNNDKVVYYERSKKDYEKGAVSFDFNVVVLNVKTGTKNIIYSYQYGVSPSSGACPFEYFPIAWSKNDEKIILEWGNTTGSGSGCVPKYETYTIDAMGGDLIGLATQYSLFTDDYSKVAYVDSSEKTPNVCGPSSQSNFGSIVFKDINTGKMETLTEEKNSEYGLISLDNNGILKYSIKKINTTNDCYYEDNSIPADEIKEIQVNIK